MFFRFLLAAFLVIMIGCLSAVAQPTTLPQNKITDRVETVIALSGGGLAFNTDNGLYLCTSDKLDRWNAIVGDKYNWLCRCAGGTTDCIYFIRLIKTLDDPNGINVNSKDNALEVWTPKDGVRRIGVFESGLRSMFTSATAGYVLDPEGLRVTTDAGKTWHAIIATLPGKKIDPSEIQVFRAHWISPVELVIFAQAQIADTGLIALFEVPAVGEPRQRWAIEERRAATDIFCYASDEAGIWVKKYKEGITVYGVADGKPITTYNWNEKYPPSEIVMHGHRLYFHNDGIVVADYDAKTIKEITNIKMPIKIKGLEDREENRIGAKLLAPQENGDVLIVGDNGQIYRWKTSTGGLSAISLQVDNKAVKEALNTPEPGQPSREESEAYVKAWIGLPPDICEKVIKEADTHKDWTLRERILWMTQEYHKFDSLRDKKWMPRTEMPPLPAAPKISPLKNSPASTSAPAERGQSN